VDPQASSRVYIGFQELYASTDSGGTFSNVSANRTHFDHHALVFTPGTHISGGPPTRLYVGTDGGIARTDNGGGSWANLNEGIATNLFLSIDIGRGSAFANDFTYGGTQDTGTIEHRPDMPGTDWHLGIDGDGGTTAVDPCDPNHAFGVDNGAYSVTTDGGANWDFNPIGLTGVGVLKADPNCRVVYAATGTQLRQSTNNGGSFTSIHTFPSGITAIATVQIDSNTLWVGLANGTVQRTSNALAGVGSTWTALTVTGAPAQPVSGIAIDPTHPDQAVVVYPGFCGGACAPGNRTRHVFRTTDNGATWTDISGTDGGGENLPDLPLHSVVIDSGPSSYTIIVASDASVLRTANLGTTWEVLGAGFPTVDAKSLALDAEISPPLLRVGTYGRSVFELTGAIEVPATCPLSQGFWNNHPDAWPVTALTLGSQTYTQAELLALFDTPPQGDASLILAHQLIAAKLNLANGALPTPISPTISDADRLLSGFAGKLPYNVRPSSATGQAMVQDANVLDSYNNGALTPGCTP
jgi:hypothetical protein